VHKKGSHVGMVLSFVIFITFLTFIYTAMSPAIKIEPSKISLLEYLKKEIINQASDTLVSVSVTTTEIPDKECWIITHSDFLDSGKFNYENMGVVVRNKDNKMVSSGIGFIGTDYTLVNWADGENFLKLYYSNENFTSPTITSCDNANSEFELGLVISKKEIFESKLLRMIEKHNESYIGLKKDLNIPFDSDFSFGIVLANGTEIITSSQNVSVNIFSGEYPIQYVDSEANIKFGTLRISVW